MIIFVMQVDWGIGSSLVVAVFSTVFTVVFSSWQTNKLRREDKQERFLSDFLDTSDTWANGVISICDKIETIVFGKDKLATEQEIDKLFKEASRLSSIKITGTNIPKKIDEAFVILADLKEKWDRTKTAKLRTICDDVKDLVTATRARKR